MTELATKYGSMPRSSSRVTALAASFVCIVLNTRCPVSDDWIAIVAVSRSRISPTMITSGSWQHAAQAAREGHALLLAHLGLADPLELVLDRVFQRDDVLL